MHTKVLSLKTINPNIVKLEYAVRGPIVQRALELEEELVKNSNKFNFDEVIKCNIGDCHATGQSPITFFRQVVAGITLPSLLNESWFPEDVKDRAKRILDSCSGHSIGSYSNSQGVKVLRKDVADYISTRDGIPCDFNNVYLSTGASEAIKAIISLISTGKSGKERAGIMIPIPQYPLYSATAAEYNAYQINYYLDEENNWGISEKELEKAYNEAKDECIPKAICIINPGNPTGQVLTKEDMKMIIRFAHKKGLVILADEVYQFNIYNPEKFPWFSFKLVLNEMEPEFRDNVELVSFMSASKGYMGECGFRGGYGELVNFDPEVIVQFYKALSARLCPSVSGQAMIGVICNPPKPGEISYESFVKERDQVLSDLLTKARLLSSKLNALEGIQCNELLGAMYAFPNIKIPQKAIKSAEKKSMKPDFMYCSELLEETGICVIPGSGFGQLPGTYHFRITILPPVEKMEKVMDKFANFHTNFLKRYS